MKTFYIYVDYKFGCAETYKVEAKDLPSARRKAKAKFAKAYFSKKYLKTEVE